MPLLPVMVSSRAIDSSSRGRIATSGSPSGMMPNQHVRAIATALISKPPLFATIGETASRHPAMSLELDPIRNYLSTVFTNSVAIVPMDERSLNPVSDPLGNVTVHDTTFFTFCIDAIHTRGQNRSLRRAELARFILGDFDPSTPFCSAFN